jgi:5-methylcytosine-specific restriction endonuclease McrA
MGQELSLNRVSDDDLLRRLLKRVGTSRRVEADLVADIGEVDSRRLYRREAAPSMFEYCCHTLHLSEAEAYLRITVARLARRHPVLLDMLRDGRLHLSGIERLAPHLTTRNRDALLKRATHKSKKEIEEIVAELAPRPDELSSIRKLPERRSRHARPSAPQLRLDGVSTGSGALSGSLPAPSRPASARPPVVEPLGEARYKVSFMATAELREKLERLQALMRTSVPGADLAKVIDAAVTRELERVEARRFAKTNTPRKRVGATDTTPSSRHIPAPVRRMVHQRDGGRCTYKARHGRRCTKRHDLEFHHKKPYGKGGEHSPENLALVCKPHNALLAEQDYGKDVVNKFRRSADGGREAPLASGP